MRYKSSETSALEKIYYATSSLIKEKDYNKINPSEIIARAEISRSTFYIYFKNKEQIITHICDDIFDHVFSTHLKKEKSHDYSLRNENDLKDIITHSFYHFLEEKELVLSILNSGASNIFLKQLRKRLKPLISSMIEKKIIGKNKVPLDLKIHQYINGYVGLIQYYLRHGENLTPEEVSKYFFEMYQ